MSEPQAAALLVEPRRSWWRRTGWWVAIVIVVVVAGLLFWRFHTPADSGQGGASKGRRGGPGGPNAVMPVGVATAKSADVNIYLTGLGSVTPVNTVTVKSRVDGQLMKLHFREGQFVKAGDLLAELDPRPFQVMVTQAEGQLARDEALLANAKVDLERYKTLVAQDSIATQQLDTQRALARQYEGTVKTDRGNLASAKLQLDYSKIGAPVGGRIGLKQVDVGNIVRAGDTTGIVVITQLQPIDVVFTVSETNVPRVMTQLAAGRTLPVDAWDRDQKVKLADGTLVTIDNQIDVATGTVKLKARFANADYKLFPNQFVNARMLLDVRRGATVIPNAAVQRGSQGNYVYIVKADDTVTARPVRPGPVQGDDVAIDEGVAVGEVVVVDGTDKLKEGAKVDPVARDGARVALPAEGTTSGATAGAPRGGGTPEERKKRWEDIDKRIDAGEFGEEIKKLPEDARKQRMQEMRRQREGAGAGKGAE